MKRSNIYSPILFVSLFFSLHGASCQAAGENGESPARIHPIVEYSETAADPVIEYNIVQHMLAQPDPEPLLRVYGDGRVHVHFPVYMKRAGDYELQLSRQEFIALLRSLTQDGILDFDHSAARNHRSQLVAQQRATNGEMHYVSDVAETVIDIQLEEYQRTPATPRIINLKKRFAWNNLEHDARRFPQSNAIQRAATGAQRIHALLERPDLKKIP